MFKKPLAIILVILIIILVIVFVERGAKDTRNPSYSTPPTASATTGVKSGPDYKNISYVIDGEEIKLTDGKAETPTSPGAATVITTEYFGNEARADINSDGTEDVVFFVAQDGGGTGIFYYVVAALSLGGTYRGTNAVFIGDRIAPHTINIRNGQIAVNYADRGPDDPMSAEPSNAVTKYLKLDKGELVEAK